MKHDPDAKPMNTHARRALAKSKLLHRIAEDADALVAWSQRAAELLNRCRNYIRAPGLLEDIRELLLKEATMHQGGTVCTATGESPPATYTESTLYKNVVRERDDLRATCDQLRQVIERLRGEHETLTRERNDAIGASLVDVTARGKAEQRERELRELLREWMSSVGGKHPPPICNTMAVLNRTVVTEEEASHDTSPGKAGAMAGHSQPKAFEGE